MYNNRTSISCSCVPASFRLSRCLCLSIHLHVRMPNQSGCVAMAISIKINKHKQIDKYVYIYVYIHIYLFPCLFIHYLIFSVFSLIYVYIYSPIYTRLVRLSLNTYTYVYAHMLTNYTTSKTDGKSASVQDRRTWSVAGPEAGQQCHNRTRLHKFASILFSRNCKMTEYRITGQKSHHTCGGLWS